MKTKVVIAVFVVVLVLNGCFIKSLHPFFTEKDVVFKKELIGTWLDQDSAQWHIEQHKQSKGFLKGGDSLVNSYHVVYCDKKEMNTEFEVHLFKLNNTMYLDFYPLVIGDNDMFNFHIVPAHSLAKVEISGQNDITIKWFNEQWLGELFKQNRIRIAHETVSENSDYVSYILTASTGDLQKFIVKYGNDPRAFKSDWEGLTKDKEEESFVFALKRLK